jgi:hypothetical protein
MAKKFTSYTNGQFMKEFFGDDLLDKVVEYVKDNFHPDDIFDESDLEEWARDNGFVKSE